jgi:hypothetical protein
MNLATDPTASNIDGNSNLHQQVQQVHKSDPGHQQTCSQRRNERPPEHQKAIRGGPVPVNDKPDVRGDGEPIDRDEHQPHFQITAKQAAGAGHESIQSESGCATEHLQRDRVTFDRPCVPVCGHEHVHRSTLDQKHENRSTHQHDGKRRGERHERRRFGYQDGRQGRDDVAQRSLQEVGEISPQQDRDEDRGAEHGDSQERLKSRTSNELNRDGRPVGGREQRAAFQQQLEMHGRLRPELPHCMLSLSC